VAGLTRVARVALLDGDHVEQPAAADGVTPRADHVRNSNEAQLAPQVRTAQVLAERCASYGGFSGGTPRMIGLSRW